MEGPQGLRGGGLKGKGMVSICSGIGSETRPFWLYKGKADHRRTQQSFHAFGGTRTLSHKKRNCSVQIAFWCHDPLHPLGLFCLGPLKQTNPHMQSQ